MNSNRELGKTLDKLSILQSKHTALLEQVEKLEKAFEKANRRMKYISETYLQQGILENDEALASYEAWKKESLK